MVITIRLAETSDYNGINKLLNELTEEIGKTKLGYRHFYRKSFRKKMFKDALKNHSAFFVVAVSGKRVVGYANLQELTTLRHATHELLIFEFVVDRKYRREGAGSKMIGWIQVFAKMNGDRCIKVFCGNDLEQAQKFYEKNGFVCENKGYKRKL